MFLPKVLDKNSIKELVERLSFFYDVDLSFLYSYEFYLNDKEDKLFICSVDLKSISELERVQGYGLYFGTFHDNQRFRLSIEGSKFINPKKNFVRINEKSLKNYVAGEDLFVDEVVEYDWSNNCPFLIVQFEDENIGSVNLKDKVFLNYVPKSRRLEFNRIF